MSYTKINHNGVDFYLFTSSDDYENNIHVQGYSQRGVVGVTDTFTGDYNPGWKAQIKSGGNATTSASGIRRIYKPAIYDSYLHYFKKNQHVDHIISEIGYPLPLNIFALDAAVPSDIIQKVTNRAIVKYLEAADSARSSFEAGQDIGEWRETIHSIINPMASLRKLTVGYFDTLKKGVKKAGSKQKMHKVISDSFLEFKFGWNPLAQDVAAGISSLTNNQGHSDSVPLQASARDSYPIHNGFYFYLGNSNAQTLTFGRVTGEYQVRFKGAIRTGAVNGHIPLLQNLQLDMPHFVPTLWDLVPYSWMIDYFANIGDVIKGLSFQSSNNLWLCKTTRIIAHYDYSYGSMNLSSLTPFGWIIDSTNPTGNPSGTSTSFTRSPVSPNSLIPNFRFQLPLGSAKPWENMGALISSNLQSIRKSISSLRR